MKEPEKIFVKPSVKITLFYFFFSVIWILVSDAILTSFFSDPVIITKLQIIKGWFFVTVSSVLIFILISKYFRLYVKSEEQKEVIREHYNNFIRKANDIIILTDSEWNIVEVNDKAVETYLYTKDELTHMNMASLRTESGNVLFNKYLETFEGVKGSVIETEHRKKNGIVFPIESTFHFLIFGDEKYIQFILRDITAIKESEDRLLKANRLYNVLTNINKSVVRDKSMDELLGSVCKILVEKGEFISSWISTFKKSNENKFQAKKISYFNLNDGYFNLVSGGIKPPDGIIGGSISCPLLNLAEKGIKTVNNNLDSVIFQCPFREKVLSLGFMSCSALPLFIFGKLYGGILIYSSSKNAFTEDVMYLLDELASDLSLALENIETRKIKKKLEQAVENSPVSIVISDRDGVIEYVNPTFLVTTGYSSEEIINKNIFDKMYWGMAEKITEVRNILEKKGEWRGEIQSITKNGSKLWELVSVSAAKLMDSENLSFVFVRENISVLKKTEEELREAKTKAEDINRLKSIFLANMNHELRTPLTGILGYANILYEELSEPHQREMAGIIMKGSKRLADTLNSILDFTGLEGKVITLNKTLNNVVDILKSYVASYSLIAKQKGLVIKFISDLDELNCFTDERLLNQIVNNLLENALKYTDTGSITINLSEIKSVKNPLMKIVINDTGIGIPKEYINLIFEPFRQVSEGNNRKFEGTGLGLTITKRFVELLEGKIDVKSESGKGSEFSVLLPLNLSEQAESGKLGKVYATADNRSRKKILVVEDDFVSYKLINAMLKDLFDIMHVPDGEKAIKEVRDHTFDLILMDINLRGMNGVDTLSMIKLLERYKHVPVIAVTAYSMSGDSDYLLMRGFDDYISKPFSKQKLLAVIENVMR